MQFYPTMFRGVWLVHLEPARDSRGYFARTFCVDEFASRELETNYSATQYFVHRLQGNRERPTLSTRAAQ